MAHVTVYTKDFCPYCVRAKSLLKSKQVEFKEINLEGQDEEMTRLKERTKFRTLPQIFIGEKFIGGYSELAELEANGGLDQLLQPEK